MCALFGCLPSSAKIETEIETGTRVQPPAFPPKLYNGPIRGTSDCADLDVFHLEA